MLPSAAGSEFWRAFRDILPLSFGVLVYGLAFGMLAAQAGLDELQVGVMGAAVFGGAAQIILVERLAAGAGAVAAITAAVALNLRLFLITASIRDDFRGRPFWQKMLGAHMTTDENWALLLSTRAGGRQAGYWYLVGGGLCLLITWLSATVAGVYFAASVPEPRALGMDFAFTAAFIAIARSLWRGKSDLLPWVCAAAVVALAMLTGWVEASWALIVAGVSGAAVAAVRGDDD